MSKVKAFRALRPNPSIAEQVASPPYDVMNAEEARQMATDLSFLHVSRSEIDLPEGADVYSAEVYQKALENLDKLQREGVLIQEDAESFYVYRLQMGEQIQTGIVACCAIDEYDNGLIKKHEKTRPDKENDRTRHIVTTQAQTGLIFLCYRGTDELNALVAEVCKDEPLYDFTAPDDIKHTIWRIAETENIVSAFEKVPAIYIADGHHRAASSSRARAEMRDQNPNHTGEESYNFVIAALFPAEQLKILPYNRIVKDLNGLSEAEFLQKLGEKFSVTETSIKSPAQKGEICLYLDGKWYLLKPNFIVPTSAIESLDVSVLEQNVLHPILGIEDVRTDKRIDFVGGIRGTAELEKLVDSGKAKLAFSMFATTIDDLLNVSDANEIMPPKSTWFEPKLRDGLLIHLIS
jgi:uncharacterized protein (DUF1015 family)